LLPFGKRTEVSCPPVPVPLVAFEKIYIYRHGGIVVRAFASQLEDLGLTLVESGQTRLKKLIFTVFLLYDLRDSVENKSESSLVVFLDKALDGIPLSLSR